MQLTGDCFAFWALPARARKGGVAIAGRLAAARLVATIWIVRSSPPALAITNAVPAWTRTRNWTTALLAFKIHFGDRLPD
jgi:hypothetical protein